MTKVEVAHQRSLSAREVALCSTKDLVAVVTAEGLFTVHRTLSWEKVFSKKCSELSEECVISMSFSPSGQHVSVAFPSSLHLLDLESGSSHAAQVFDDPSGDLIRSSLWLPQTLVEDAPSGLPNHALLLVLASGTILVLAFALFPVASLPTSSLSSCSMTAALTGERLELHASSPASTPSSSLRSWAFPWSAEQLRGFAVLAHSYIVVKSTLGDLEAQAAQWGRKFKDALKVLPMKLTLAAPVLSSYALSQSLPDLFLSLCMCGLHHPSLSVIFSQHWNEQSLQRLRSHVDIITRALLRFLRCKLQSKLQEVDLTLRSAEQLVSAPEVRQRAALVQVQVLRAVLAVDDAVVQAQDCRERMLSVIQVIRDAWLEATVPTHKPDLDLRLQCSAWFALNHRQPADQAEHLVGTFLSTHLQPASALMPQGPSKAADLFVVQAADVEGLFTEAPLLIPQLKALGAEHGRMVAAHLRSLPVLAPADAAKPISFLHTGGCAVLCWQAAPVLSIKAGTTVELVNASIGVLAVRDAVYVCVRSSAGTAVYACAFRMRVRGAATAALGADVVPGDECALVVLLEAGAQHFLHRLLVDDLEFCAMSIVAGCVDLEPVTSGVLSVAALALDGLGAAPRLRVSTSRGIAVVFSATTCFVLDINADDEEDEDEDDEDGDTVCKDCDSGGDDDATVEQVCSSDSDSETEQEEG